MSKYTQEELDKYTFDEMDEYYRQYRKLDDSERIVAGDLKDIIEMYASHEFWENYTEEYWFDDFNRSNGDPIRRRATRFKRKAYKK